MPPAVSAAGGIYTETIDRAAELEHDTRSAEAELGATKSRFKSGDVDF